MTNREFFNAVISANISDELSAKAQELIAGLDAKNEKRKSPESKSKLETSARRELVLACIRSAVEPINRESIAEQTGLTPAQVTGACTALIKDGTISKKEIKVDKARKVVYFIPSENSEE